MSAVPVPFRLWTSRPGESSMAPREGESSHEGSRGDRRDPEARGRGDHLRLSGQPCPGGRRARRHPHDHRAPGAHRPAHGRRHVAADQRQKIGVFAMQHGPAPRTPSAASPRPMASRCRSWSCRWATRARSPGSSRTSTPSSTCATSPNGPSRSSLTAECRTSCAAPSPAATAAAAPVLVEIPCDVFDEELAEPLDLHAGRPAPRRPRSRRGARRRQTPARRPSGP